MFRPTRPLTRRHRSSLNNQQFRFHIGPNAGERELPMPQREKTYSYRGGQKIQLEKSPDQFVIRANPDKLKTVGIVDSEKVSPSSSRVTVRSTDLEPM